MGEWVVWVGGGFGGGEIFHPLAHYLVMPSVSSDCSPPSQISIADGPLRLIALSALTSLATAHRPSVNSAGLHVWRKQHVVLHALKERAYKEVRPNSAVPKLQQHRERRLLIPKY